MTPSRVGLALMIASIGLFFSALRQIMKYDEHTIFEMPIEMLFKVRAAIGAAVILQAIGAALVAVR